MNSLDGVQEPLLGRDQEGRLIRLYLENGISCLIVGPHGVGKTTLLWNVGEIAKRLQERFLVAVTSCAELKWEGLLQKMSTAWGMQDTAADLSEMSVHVERMLREDTCPVLCLDDVDILSSPDGARVLRSLIGLIDSGVLTFATVTSRVVRGFPRNLPSRALLDRFQLFYLGPLSAEASEAVIGRYLRDVPLTSEEIQEVVTFSHGQPFVLQEAIKTVANSRGQGKSVEEALQDVERRIQFGAEPRKGSIPEPLEAVSSPGCYILIPTGQLLRIPEDALSPQFRSPRFEIVSKERSLVSKISNDPYTSLSKARMLAADMDLHVNF